MTDRDLAASLVQARDLEISSKAVLSKPDLAERDAAMIVFRHATALRKSLETWIATRAVRREWQASHQ